MEIPACLRHITRSLGGYKYVLGRRGGGVRRDLRMMARHGEGSVLVRSQEPVCNERVDLSVFRKLRGVVKV
jgi:hypothetical protein